MSAERLSLKRVQTVRISDKIVPLSDGCWLWTGSVTSGYGSATLNRRPFKAHRLVYEACVGLIPDGLTLDHRCGNTRCVNPQHLELVTASENASRSQALREPATHCRRGHAFTAANTMWKQGGPRSPGLVRRCRICHNAYNRKRVLERRPDGEG